MSNKLFIFTSVLIAALLGLLSLLIHWGNKSIELREALFVDQVNIATEEVVKELESDYYCFTLLSEASLPQLESFYLMNPANYSKEIEDTLSLGFVDGEGEYHSFSNMPLIAPARLQMQLKFDFDDIPDFREDSTLTSFEIGVRDYYDQYIYDSEGNRLIDTNQLDSLLHLAISKLYPEAVMSYSVILKESGENIYSKNRNLLSENESPDVTTSIFKNDDKVPEMGLSLVVVNKKEIFTGEAWNIYISAGLLALLSILLIFLLIRMQVQQRKMMKIQKDFVHGMTHEFNTPLSNIKLIAQNLLKSNDDKVLKSGKILDEEAGKLQVGTNLILTTALIEKNELLLQKEVTDIKKLLLKTADRNKSVLYDSGIELDIHLEKEDLESAVDAFHLENVFQNMINNVRKHSNASLLKVNMERNNGHVVIKFEDNGKGIDDAERGKIFEKFESKHRNGGKNGYGLGLYYSRMILEMHGGGISLLENGGRGSIFSIQLPA